MRWGLLLVCFAVGCSSSGGAEAPADAGQAFEAGTTTPSGWASYCTLAFRECPPELDAALWDYQCFTESDAGPVVPPDDAGCSVIATQGHFSDVCCPPLP
jgi:hypothetical protein